MSETILLDIALSLPTPDIEALIQGRMIAAMAPRWMNQGERFALYPANVSKNLVPLEGYYRTSFLSIAQKVFANSGSPTVLIQAWAKCELCQMLDASESLEAVSELTIWKTEALQQRFKQRPYIFLAYLRIYLLPQQIEIPLYEQERHFVPLPQQLKISEAQPVLSDRVFHLRKHQLETRQPPQHPELEDLQSALAQISPKNLAAKNLEEEIKILLGWSNNKSVSVDSDLAWIHQIAKVGNSSEGHSFEKLVRKGLLKLGFIGLGLAADSTGGAGGMDFYGEYPYPIVGECKATKTEKVSDGTPAQLHKIGLNHLGKAQYDRSIKLIVAAGELNFYALRTATEHEMNVIKPETLQRLVEMQAHYQGSINLLELKQCLQQTPFGLADDKVNSYIDKVYQNIKLRIHIVQVLKNYLEATKYESAGVEGIFGAYVISHPPQSLESREIYEILIELSSPLTGYLGRNKDNDGKSDRFYFLRDLPITST